MQNANELRARGARLNAKGAFRAQNANRPVGRSNLATATQCTMSPRPRAASTRARPGAPASRDTRSRHTLAVPSGHRDTHRGDARQRAPIDRKRRESLAPNTQRTLDIIGAGPAWSHDYDAEMKPLSMQTLVRKGLNYEKNAPDLWSYTFRTSATSLRLRRWLAPTVAAHVSNKRTPAKRP